MPRTRAEKIQIRQMANALTHLRQIVEVYPLASATLWHRDKPRSSQRSGVQKCLTPGLMVAVLLGGNRSGKTEAGAQMAAAFAHGGQHPATQIWAHRNGLDVSALPQRPGLVCASALSSNDSVRVLRPKIAKYLPKKTKWANQHGHGEAIARLPDGGSVIFKSNDQRARAYQGADWDLLWADEEHDHPVFSEARMRLVDRAGRALLTMTPLRGRTWVWQQFIDEPEPGSVHYSIISSDNPHIPQEYLSALLAQYGAHERAARERGEFTALEGRVYSEFRHDLHVVASHPIPTEWPRFQAWDFGSRNPTAVLWAALDPGADVLHIYREHYRANWTIKQHAERVRGIETCSACKGSPSDGVAPSCTQCTDHPGRSEPLPQFRVADSAARGERSTLAREHNLSTIRARKEIRPGINSVAERIAPSADGRPGLLVHDCCRNTIRELEGYIWNKTKSRADDPDMPLKLNDHAMDAIRYLCHQLSRISGSGASA